MKINFSSPMQSIKRRFQGRQAKAAPGVIKDAVSDAGAQIKGEAKHRGISFARIFKGNASNPMGKALMSVLPVALIATTLMSLTGFIKNKKDGSKGKIEGNAGKIAGLGFGAAAMVRLAKTNVLKEGEKGFANALKSIGTKAGVIAAGTLAVGIASMVISDVIDGIIYNKKLAKRDKLIEELNKSQSEEKTQETSKEDEKPVNIPDEHTYVPSSQSTVSFNSFLSMVKENSNNAPASAPLVGLK